LSPRPNALSCVSRHSSGQPPVRSDRPGGVPPHEARRPKHSGLTGAPWPGESKRGAAICLGGPWPCTSGCGKAQISIEDTAHENGPTRGACQPYAQQDPHWNATATAGGPPQPPWAAAGSTPAASTGRERSAPSDGRRKLAPRAAAS
jgi:hypothetical protein